MDVEPDNAFAVQLPKLTIFDKDFPQAKCVADLGNEMCETLANLENGANDLSTQLRDLVNNYDTELSKLEDYELDAQTQTEMQAQVENLKNILKRNAEWVDQIDDIVSRKKRKVFPHVGFQNKQDVKELYDRLKDDKVVMAMFAYLKNKIELYTKDTNGTVWQAINNLYRGMNISSDLFKRASTYFFLDKVEDEANDEQKFRFLANLAVSSEQLMEAFKIENPVTMNETSQIDAILNEQKRRAGLKGSLTKSLLTTGVLQKYLNQRESRKRFGDS